MATTTAIEAKLREIIKTTLELSDEAAAFAADEPLSNIGLNSLSFIRLIVGIEGEFDFEFDDEDLNFTVFQTLQDVVSYIDSRVA